MICVNAYIADTLHISHEEEYKILKFLHFMIIFVNRQYLVTHIYYDLWCNILWMKQWNRSARTKRLNICVHRYRFYCNSNLVWILLMDEMKVKWTIWNQYL